MAKSLTAWYEPAARTFTLEQGPAGLVLSCILPDCQEGRRNRFFTYGAQLLDVLTVATKHWRVHHGPYLAMRPEVFFTIQEVQVNGVFRIFDKKVTDEMGMHWRLATPQEVANRHDCSPEDRPVAHWMVTGVYDDEPEEVVRTYLTKRAYETAAYGAKRVRKVGTGLFAEYQSD